jgi:hypothetical protein
MDFLLTSYVSTQLTDKQTSPTNQPTNQPTKLTISSSPLAPPKVPTRMKSPRSDANACVDSLLFVSFCLID